MWILRIQGTTSRFHVPGTGRVEKKGYFFTILIDGYKISVRPNLFWALVQIRRVLKDGTHWWIDAIHIDQAYFDEKDVQAPMMSDIYSKCFGTHIWLGPADRSLIDTK